MTSTNPCAEGTNPCADPRQTGLPARIFQGKMGREPAQGGGGGRKGRAPEVPQLSQHPVEPRARPAASEHLVALGVVCEPGVAGVRRRPRVAPAGLCLCRAGWGGGGVRGCRPAAGLATRLQEARGSGHPCPPVQLPAHLERRRAVARVVPVHVALIKGVCGGNGKAQGGAFTHMATALLKIRGGQGARGSRKVRCSAPTCEDNVAGRRRV